MSIQYTEAVATSPAKNNSRNKVAQSMRDSMKDNSIIHYLGGTSTQTPFENEFEGKDTTFVRYERMRALVPSGYKQVLFGQGEDDVILPKYSTKYFVNDDFFDCFHYVHNEVNKKVKGEETHLWLDFCGMPKSDLLDCIYFTFLEESGYDFKSLYLTFFMNPRSCKDMKNMFTGEEKTLEERANTMLNKIKQIWDWHEQEDKTIEVFDTYHNDKSPMVVFKIERREAQDMANTASVENYVNLRKRGFTNKQIAVFWKAGIMQVAGFAAHAKRKQLI